MKDLVFRAPSEPGTIGELVARAWPRADRGQRQRVFARGRVRVDGEVVRDPRRPVAPGAPVRVSANEGRLAPPSAAVAVLQRGADFCVVDKPVGWPSHAATPGGPDARDCVARALGCAPDALWPVHRLDAEVGGAWLIATTKSAAARLGAAFENAAVEKEYRAIAPAVPWPEGVLRAGIDGRPAETRFRIVGRDGDACELSLVPVTGRTHQLRRHLAGAGCPIVGDVLHGGVLVAGGLRLYSRRIAIAGEGIDATAPEPAGFAVAGPLFAAPAEPPVVRVSAATIDALGRGHPWILTDTETSDVGRFRPGALARVRGPRGADAALCRIAGPGRIAGRVWPALGRGPDDFAARVRAALRRRAALLGARETTAFRLIHGEADGLPGLAVDRLGDELRAIELWRGAEAFVEPVVDALREALGEVLGREAPVVRVRHFDDAPKGELACVEALRGEPRRVPFEVTERGLRFAVDSGIARPRNARPGVGLFCDQRENRERMAERVRARGGRWLNLFCHTGAFSVAALAAGADFVVSVDLSRPYLDALEANLARNGLDAARHRSVKLDAPRFVERLDGGERFDGIVLDPPTAASAGRRFWSARKRSADLIASCLARLAPGGVLLACRNEQGGRGRLAGVVRAAAAEAGVVLRAVEPAPPGADFPRLEGFPEGDAFEGVWVERA